MEGLAGRFLSAMIVPIIVLALIGLLYSCVTGQRSKDCPIDPVTKKAQCSPWKDHEAWSRATAAQM